MSSSFNSFRVAKLFVDIVVRLYWFLGVIISDRDLIFLSQILKRLFELSGTKLKHSTAYHPQMDGQTEVVNRELEEYLRVFTQEKPSTWFCFLSWAKFSYKSEHDESIGMSHFQAVYGRLPPTIPFYVSNSTPIQALDVLLLEGKKLLEESL